MSAAERVLERLDGVQKAGRGWIARCPAHDDNSPSLSVAEGRDGRLLVHCFAQCATSDVLAAIGLSSADLFEQRISHATNYAERSALREQVQLANWRAALGVLARESVIVLCAAIKISRGGVLSSEDVARLELAVSRIEAAREVLTR